MTMRHLPAALVPFRVRSFRFQWPADLATSWAFEMETLILGWYVLVETGSVLWLTVFGSLQFIGTLVAPIFGVVADRMGRRFVMAALRVIYLVCAATLMGLALGGVLTPVLVLVVAFVAGLARPSDISMRTALIGDTVPGAVLTNALGLSRITMDSARIMGALAGAGLFAALGIGPAYIFVTGFYVVAFVLTLGVAGPTTAQPDSDTDSDTVSDSVSESGGFAPWRELKDGLAFVRDTPIVLALMLLAFLINLTAYPIVIGLLPHVAKDIYAIDEVGLSHLVAAFAAGALLGSIIMTVTGGPRRQGLFMLIGIAVWFTLSFVFALQEAKWPGFWFLVAMGVAQSTGMIALSAILIQVTPARFRGRVMGVRILAVYGLPLGLLGYGALIDWFGFLPAAGGCTLASIAVIAVIGWRWRRELWM
jgi:predicted MFS family arabinose efflux permease